MPAAQAAASSQAVPPAGPAPAGQEAQVRAALEAADAILQQMSRITGLPVKADLRKQLISKPGMIQYLKDNLSAELPPKELHAQEASLKAFGIVSADFDLEKFLISFYTEQAAGFYDPRRKTMFMADWVPADLQKTVLAHELTHALQDQSFDLWKFMHATRENDDATAARQALVEGYATLAMIQASLGPVPVEKVPSLDALMGQLVNEQMSEFPVFTKAPFFLRYEALFPYVEGAHFARRGLELGGWERLNRAFSNPPASTAQIFNPDLYFDPQASQAEKSEPDEDVLTLPAPPALEQAKGIKQVDANEMGEVGYYALLGQFASQAEAQKVSPSWRADHYRIYEGPRPGEYTLLARTSWSTPSAAAEFCGDYRAILQQQSPADAGAQPPPRGLPESPTAEILLRTSGPRRSFLLKRADECSWVAGVPARLADAVENWLAGLP